MNTDLRNGGRFLIIGIPGCSVDEETRKIIKSIQPAGFILFGRNIKAPEQLRDLLDDLRALVDHTPIVTIDQEGGRVSRLKEIGQEPPSIKQLRDKGDIGLIARHGKITGKLLRLFGFNLNLCPVLDISFNDDADNSLRNRTFGHNPQDVVARAEVFTQAMREQGILSCGKHFPSYAAAEVDPHHYLPEINRTEEELEANEWVPFRQLAARGLLDSIMVGHIKNRHLDPSGKVSTLSSLFIKRILREKWGYNNCVITDDMDMGAILNEYDFEEAMRESMIAGNDLILLCHRIHMAVQAAEILAQLPDGIVTHSAYRIAAMRNKLAPPMDFDLEKFKRYNDEIWDLRVATLGEIEASRRSPDDGKRSPVEIF